MIVSLFGPDGVGKSVVAKELIKKGWPVFSGTGVASWPDPVWHNELLSKGLHEPSIDNPEHFLEKIKRLYELAHKIDQTEGIAVIDSNSFHKTLMHDYVRALPDRERAGQMMRSRFNQLRQMIGDDRSSELHIYLQVSDSLSNEEQAKILQQRVHGRGELAYFDPSSLRQSFNMIQAYQELVSVIKEHNEHVITIFTDRPLDTMSLDHSIESIFRA